MGSSFSSLRYKNSTSSEDVIVSENSELISVIPLEILVSILLNLDINSILRCRRVSVYLCSVVSSINFWHQIVTHHVSIGNIPFKLLWQRTTDWDWKEYAILCIKDPFSKNLIKNGSGEMVTEHEDIEHGSGGKDNLNSDPHWEIVASRGDGWQVERPPIGCDAVPNDPDVVEKGCFVTSWSECSRKQTVDLWQAVGTDKMLSTLQPYIVVSVWVCARFDCASQYDGVYSLKNEEGKLLQKRNAEVSLECRQPWQQVRIKFPYVPSVRFVEFADRGIDRNGWRGWYGAKITGAAVKLVIQ